MDPVVETHFLAFQTSERPLGALGWPQLLALTLAAPFVLWAFLNPLSPYVRSLLLVPVATAVGASGREDLLALAVAFVGYARRPHRHVVALRHAVGVFRP